MQQQKLDLAVNFKKFQPFAVDVTEAFAQSGGRLCAVFIQSQIGKVTFILLKHFLQFGGASDFC